MELLATGGFFWGGGGLLEHNYKSLRESLNIFLGVFHGVGPLPVEELEVACFSHRNTREMS